MGAVLNSCVAAATINNTGVECDVTMLATARVYMVPVKDSWTDADETDMLAFITGRLHAAKGQRWYPLFGEGAEIDTIENNKEGDVLQNFDNGSSSLVRKGYHNVTFWTSHGGECYAKALKSFDRASFCFVEVDSNYQIKRRVKSKGVYGGFPINLCYAVTPTRSDFKAVGMNGFFLSFNPEYYNGQGSIGKTEDDLTSPSGLLDVAVTDAGGSTTTKLKVNVMTECGASDLVALFGNTLAALGNFTVTDAATKAVVVPTAIAIVSGHIELTGAFTSGHSYIVSLVAPSVLLAADIEGYEGIDSATILIP